MSFSRQLPFALIAFVLSIVSSVRVQAEDLRLVRSEFQILAPYLSMDAEFTMELLDSKAVGKKLARIGDYASTGFKSHPLLVQVGNDHMRYLVESEARIIPIIRAQEFEPGPLFVELLSRYMEHKALKTWQIDSDKKCGIGYSTIMPVARLLAAKPARDMPSNVTAAYGNGSLSLVQNIGRDISNVTIRVRLISITGRLCEAFYFTPTWKKNASYLVRIPTIWEDIGANGTIELMVEVLSDEHSTDEFQLELSKNRDYAAKKAISDISLRSRDSPAAAMDWLKSLSTNVSKNDEVMKQVVELRKHIRRNAELQITQFLRQIKQDEQQVAGLKKSLKDKRFQQRRESIQIQIQKSEDRIDSLRKDISELRRLQH